MPALFPSRLKAVSQVDHQSCSRLATLARSKTNWADTLHLPRSPFPARPPAEQIEVYRKRCADDLYAWQRIYRPQTRSAGGKTLDNEFVLHDGPPYANGAVHVGHALNKILKDLILRWEITKGKRVHYVPGWDCHGLPIELKALQRPSRPAELARASKDVPEQESKAAITTSSRMRPVEIRKAARALASETIEEQKKSFRAWGVMGDWDRAYRTMDRGFELQQLEVFRKMVQQGLIYRRHRPVYWSPSSRTALAEAELEYDEIHECTAAFVKMPFVHLPKALKSQPSIRPGNISALIWTTTPWTLPANQAIAVGPAIEYSVIELDTYVNGQSKDQLLIAKDRLEHVLSQLPAGTSSKTIVESILGSTLADGTTTCFNLFRSSESPVLKANFVTTASGTGVVHMAPGHGMEDYQVCQQNGIDTALAPVDNEGKFTADAISSNIEGPQLHGLDAQTDGVKAVIEILRRPPEHLSGSFSDTSGFLFKAHKYVHKNPIDWRTKQPVIVRATAQWFADVSAIKSRALRALDAVKFIPESGQARLKSFVEGRSQWCISRQRAWGVPIPALYHKETGEECVSDLSISHIISTVAERGTDAWFSDADDTPWVHPSLDPEKWTRGADTMDVWFDSGTTWTGLAQRNHDLEPRSDVYLEGSDQHRGWFQSSLLTAIAVQDPKIPPRAPYKILATHGFTLDAAGLKMSKSIGNVISPDQIIAGSLLSPSNGKSKTRGQKTPANKSTSLGPDVLRLWVASSDYTRDVVVSPTVLASVQQALQKYRVTMKFLLGVLQDYPAGSIDLGLLSQLDFADQVALHQLCQCSAAVHEAFNEYRFHTGVAEINRFINLDLSAVYFEMIKDRVYAGSEAVRRRTQTVLFIILHELLDLLGPVVPHLVEEVCEWMPAAMRGAHEQDVGLQLRPLRRVRELPLTLESLGLDVLTDLGGAIEAFRQISAAVKLAQEAARNDGRLGNGLACRVEVHVMNPLDQATGSEFLRQWSDGESLASLLVVSHAQILFVPSDRSVMDDGTAEPRWRYEQRLEPGSNPSPLQGKVVVLPPEQHKCVRCWRYTAEEEDLPCSRCQAVLAESTTVD